MENNSIGKYGSEVPFFHQLRRGVDKIEKQVKALSQLVDSDFTGSSAHQAQEDVSHGKRLDMDVRNAYV